MNERTVAPNAESSNHIESPAAAATEAFDAEAASTRVIGRRQLTCDGVDFEWWAVGERPSLVTVRSTVFGSRADFCDGNIEAYAMELAAAVLSAHYSRNTFPGRGSAAKKVAAESGNASPFAKPGWFNRE